MENEQPHLRSVWGYLLPVELLDATSRKYLDTLPDDRPSVEWIWQEMDRVWEDTLSGVSVASDREAFFRRFYSHPVWLLNGVFTATDPESLAHRNAISGYVATLNARYIVDYGGGFGVLARMLAEKLPKAHIEILEPFASAVGKAAVGKFENIGFAAAFGRPCDVMIAQDVLEHVERPTELAVQMAQAVKPGGHLIFANCFWPVIKCHLTQTFYLRRWFRVVMRGLGLEFMGTVNGAPHAEIYRRPTNLDLERVRRSDRLARVLGTPLSAAEDLIRPIMSRIRSRK